MPQQKIHGIGVVSGAIAALQHPKLGPFPVDPGTDGHDSSEACRNVFTSRLQRNPLVKLPVEVAGSKDFEDSALSPLFHGHLWYKPF